MKKNVLHIFAVAALLLCTTASFAQGIKIYQKDGKILDIPANQLDRIEAYDATPAGQFFEGVWKMKKLVTDKESMDATWGGMATYGDAYPAFNANDQLTIGNGNLTPELQSTFKNFFTGNATYEVLPGAYSGIRVGMQPIDLTILKVTGVNRYFSATETSQSNVAYIGIREIEDEDADEAGVMLLDVYLLDYESHSFATELLDFGMYASYDETPYVATSTGMYINFQMEKIGEVAPITKQFFEGSWTMNQLVTDKEYMDNTWGGMATYGDAFPAFNANDQLTFNNGALAPALQSTLKNFFTGNATYEVLPDTYSGIRVGMQPIDLTILKVTGVNRYFSASETSQSNVAYIGVREIEDEDADEAGVMLLDVYLLDYESHSFATELLDFGMYASYDETPYVATSTGMYINFTMKKKAE